MPEKRTIFILPVLVHVHAVADNIGLYFTNPVTEPLHTAQRLPQGRYEGAGTVMGVRCLRRNGLGLRHGVRCAEGTRLQRSPTGAASQGAQSYLSRRVLMGTQCRVY